MFYALLNNQQNIFRIFNKDDHVTKEFKNIQCSNDKNYFEKINNTQPNFVSNCKDSEIQTDKYIE